VTFAGKIQERIPRITKTTAIVAIYPAMTTAILAVGHHRAGGISPSEAKKELKESKRESKKESKKK